MSYPATIIEVFLSSPSDVNAERNYVVELAAEWNRLRGRDMQCYISILTWEEMVAPALHERSQLAVSDQIGNTYDVYLGMMWTRLGTPTGIAESGTVEEFDDAFARAVSGDPIRIAALFKRGQVDPFAVDAKQLQMVSDFKIYVAEKGLFYREFSDDNSLRSILNLLFEQIAKDKDRYEHNENGKNKIVLEEINDDVSKNFIDDAEQVGLIELGEQFEILAAEFTKKLIEIGKKEEDNTNIIKECSHDIDAMLQGGGANPAAAKKIMSKAAAGMDGLASYLDITVPIVDNMALSMAQMIDEDLRIRLDFDDPLQSASENIESIKELALNIDSAVSNIDVLIQSTESLPRLSTEVNKAKKKILKPRKRLRDIFVSLSQSINNSVDYFESRL